MNTLSTVLLVILTIALSNNVEAKSTTPPNIILITADDLGFDDLSIHGNPLTHTKNLDALAKKSVSFSDFSVSPVCSTTRASLFTGRHFYKTGVSGVHGGRDALNLNERLLSNVLSDNNYRTGMWGKWHLGKTDGYFPHERGFDQAYYAELYQHKQSYGFLNGKRVQHNQWVSEVITDYAIDFIDQPAEKPFFAHISYLAPHEPWLAPNKFVRPYIDQGLRESTANLYGMINEMDYHLGRLFKALAASGKDQNTIIIFLSDNGPWWDSSNLGAMTTKEWQQRNPTQFKGNKGQTWQNGIKSPLFIYWPEKWQNKTIKRYVDVKDIFPTLLDLLNITLPKNHKPLDGQSFLAYLNGNVKGRNNRVTYLASHDVISNQKNFNQWTPITEKTRNKMKYSEQLIGLRTEQYKLLLNPAIDRTGYPKSINGYVLIDLFNDPLEQHNIIEKEPVLAEKLISQLQQAYENIITNPEAFAVPEYLINANSVSVVNGFGPSATSGNVTSKPHHLSEFKNFGDSSKYRLIVDKTQEYDVYIKLANPDAAGINIKISTANDELTYALNEQLIQKVGSLSLTKGKTEFTFSTISNASYKPWAKISGLRRFFFVPKDQPVNLSTYDYPY